MDLIGPTKKQLGERAQAHVIAKFLEVGYNVLVPYGDSSRYDLVIEDAEGRFWRVQVKSAWIEGGNQGGTSSSQLPRCAHAQLTGMLHTVGQDTRGR